MYNAQPLQLRQVRDLGQNIADTFTFLKYNWKPIYSAIGLIGLPPLIIMGLALKFGMGTFFEGLQTGRPTGAVGGFIGIMAILYILMIAFFILCYAMVNEYIGAYVRNEHVGMSVGTLMRRGLSHFWSYFGIGFLSGLMIIAGTVFCILPGIYLWVNVVLAPASYAVERNGASEAISRSFQLTKNNWWESFGIGVLIFLIQYVIQQIIQLPLSLLLGVGIFAGLTPASGNPEEAMHMMTTVFPFLMIIGMVGGMITYPISSIAAALRYFTLVEKREQVGLGEQVNKFEQL